MLNSLFCFLVYSLPPLFGWWLAFRAPLGRRRFKRNVLIEAPFDAAWERIDPRGAAGGWAPLLEMRDARIMRESPLALSFFRRRRFSDEVFIRGVDTCDIDSAAGCIQRIERELDGARIPTAQAAKSACTLTPIGDATRLSLIYERPTRGLLAYEMTRLSLKADLAALHDAIVGDDPKVVPLLRFSGWRMAFLSIVTALIVMSLLLAPGFYIALEALGVSPRVLFEHRALAGVLALVAATLAAYLTTIFIFCTLVHELGHAVALLAFGHRGVTVSLIPFGGGGVALGARPSAGAFEEGIVALAGPALSAAVALALLPDPSILSALMRYATADDAARATLTAPGMESLYAMTGALIAFFTLLINVPNVLPWTGSDGAQALRAIFSDGRLRFIGAIALTLLLTFAFARRDDLLPFALLFAVLTWFNRNRATRPFAGVTGGAARRALVAAGLVLTVGLYAYEAAALRKIEWGAAQAPEKPAAS